MPRHGGDKGIGYNEGGGVVLVGKGGKKCRSTQETKRQPKDGRQTIAREVGLRETGRGRRPKQMALSVVSP